jgi:type IV secretion system protein VirD4
MAAAPRDPGGRDSWHEDRGAKLLRYLLHTAAVVGASMYEVKAWVHDAQTGLPGALLASRGQPGWAEALESLLAHDGDYLASVITAAEAALGWMDDPAMAAVACPAPGEGFRAREFITRGCGSVYLVGEDREHGSLAPYFAAFAAELFWQAKTVAEDSGGRLPVPFTMALDELATIVPVPFDKWTAVAAGYNVTLIGGIQSPSQLPARWGEQGAKTIRNNTTIKVIGGGFTEPEDLEALSLMCGEVDTWHHVRHDGSKTRQPDKQRLYPPERVGLLPAWHALVRHRNARPVEVKVTPVWDRPGYEPALPVPAAVPAVPAIGAPARTPIAPPYRPELSAPKEAASCQLATGA